MCCLCGFSSPQEKAAEAVYQASSSSSISMHASSAEWPVGKVTFGMLLCSNFARWIATVYADGSNVSCALPWKFVPRPVSVTIPSRYLKYCFRCLFKPFLTTPTSIGRAGSGRKDRMESRAWQSRRPKQLSEQGS